MIDKTNLGYTSKTNIAEIIRVIYELKFVKFSLFLRIHIHSLVNRRGIGTKFLKFWLYANNCIFDVKY